MADTTENNGADEMEVFLNALEIPGERERMDYLDRVCGDNSSLRSNVLSLLEHHHDDDGVLGTSAVDLQASMPDSDPLAGERGGTVIGPYTLGEKLGEGGCGVVYAARQEKPLRRDVAIKILKLGMDTREVIARFDAERQALARMDHPHIARVIDAGATQTGRPYFVMERVDGKRITEFCDTNQHTIEQRIRLFINVCQAVQHAHQKGLIHRDLKPSNILVSTQETDRTPIPKIIDFGIAKATGERLTNLTLVTQADKFLGTPAYMSPEQAAGGDASIDTQSDIYSLGVVLYELLTGHTPFAAADLQAAGPLGMRKIIAEKDPHRPSTVATRLKAEDRVRIAKQHGNDPIRWPQRLKGDLDRVVMKALAKSKEHRYATVDALAEDLHRYLRHEPVTAMPPSAGYRFRKFARRHRVAVGAAGIIAVLLAAGTYLNLQETRRATRAEALATANERKARVAAQKSEQTARIMSGILDAAAPSVAAGRDPQLMWDILDSTVQRLDAEKNLFPEVEAELRMKIGKVMMDLGRNAEAEPLFLRSLAIFESIHEPTHPNVIATMRHISSAVGNLERIEECDAWRGRALERLRSKYPGDHFEVSQLLQLSAQARISLKDFGQATALLREALEMNRRLLPHHDIRLVESYSLLGRSLRHLDEDEEARAMFEQALAICRKAEAPVGVAVALDDLAILAIQQGNVAEAESHYRESLVLKSKHQGSAHPDTSHAHAHLAHTLERQEKWQEAESHLRACLNLRQRLYPDGHPMIRSARQGLAKNLQQQGRPHEAGARQPQIPAAASP